MTVVNHPQLYRYTIPEKLSFCRSFIALLHNCTLPPKLQKDFENFYNCWDRCRKSCLPKDSDRMVKTRLIQECLQNLRKQFQCFRKLAEANQYHFELERAEAATYLYSAIQKLGPNPTYKAQVVVVSTLVGFVSLVHRDENMQRSIAILQLSKEYNVFSTTCQRMKELRRDRAVYDIKKVNNKDEIRAMVAAYHRFEEKRLAYLEFYPDQQELKKVGAELSVLSKKYNRDSKFSFTMRKKRKLRKQKIEQNSSIESQE